VTRQLLLAALHAAAGVIKGQRLFWEAVDDVSAWFCGLADALDPGSDDEDDLLYVPEAQVTW
jgi:hypothetical protein